MGSKTDKIKSTGGLASTEVTPFGAQVHNQKFFQFIYQLNAKYLSHLSKPVIDQTQYAGNVNLSITADMGDLNSIRKALAAWPGCRSSSARLFGSSASPGCGAP